VWQSKAMMKLFGASSALACGGAILAVVGSLGCSAGTENQGGAGGGATSSASGTGGSSGTFGMTGSGGAPALGDITGKVLAPEGTIPISGALVYVSPKFPDPIPDTVYCDRCVEITPTTDYAFSKADGTFDLAVHATGPMYLVVQKGQFRRIRAINVSTGMQPVDASLTTLPGRTNQAAGDSVPKMAVRIGQWDSIESSLQKLGIAPDAFDRFEYKFPPDPNDPLSPDKLFDDYDNTLSKYHIVFVPCSGSTGTTCDDSTTSSATVKANLQKFVEAGGRLYVTDYSYDFVRQPWPDYVDWVDQTSAIGSACLSGAYDSTAMNVDPGLEAWMTAQGIPTFQVVQSWTAIDKVNAVATTDLDAKPVTVTPKVWVWADTGQGVHPSTISFERSCGRVLFSTYHTEGTGGATLIPQEKALLYVLLEVAVCQNQPLPK
jgi:hypothetical protein